MISNDTLADIAVEFLPTTKRGMKRFIRFLLIVGLVALAYYLYTTHKEDLIKPETKTTSVSHCANVDLNIVEKCLSTAVYNPGEAPIASLSAAKAKDVYVPAKAGIAYSNLDSLNRAGNATGILNSSNLGPSKGRESQVWKPTGFKNQKITINGKSMYPYNRGHLIPYVATFNLDIDGNPSPGESGSIDNPKNLTTQTTASNGSYMGYIEDQLTKQMKSHKVYYSVTPVFRGNELVPRGYWVILRPADSSAINAKNTFNVYIWNVQPGASIDYSTGIIKPDPSVVVPSPSLPAPSAVGALSGPLWPLSRPFSVASSLSPSAGLRGLWVGETALYAESVFGVVGARP